MNTYIKLIKLGIYMYHLKFFILILLIMLNSCSQSFQESGLSKNKIKDFKIEIGKTSKQNLIKNYGPPIFENIFNKNTVYYVSHNTSYKTLEKRKTDKLLVYEIILDDNDIVRDYRQYNEKDGYDIDISKNEDKKGFDLTLFWKDIINAMRRKNIEN